MMDSTSFLAFVAAWAILTAAFPVLVSYAAVEYSTLAPAPSKLLLLAELLKLVLSLAWAWLSTDTTCSSAQGVKPVIKGRRGPGGLNRRGGNHAPHHHPNLGPVGDASGAQGRCYPPHHHHQSDDGDNLYDQLLPACSSDELSEDGSGCGAHPDLSTAPLGTMQDSSRAARGAPKPGRRRAHSSPSAAEALLESLRPALQCLLPAACLLVTTHISFVVLRSMPCYAFAQLLTLNVAAAAVLKGDVLRTRMPHAAWAALALLLVAVCVGQGMLGGEPYTGDRLPEEAILLPAAQQARLPCAAAGHGQHVPWRAAVAAGLTIAVLTGLATRCLLLPRLLLHAQPQPQPQPQPQHSHAWQQPQPQPQPQLQPQQWPWLFAVGCILNLVLFGLHGGQLDAEFFDDLRPAHWLLVLALAGGGLVMQGLYDHHAHDADIVSGCGYALAAVLAAWGSVLLLEEPPTLLFAFSSLVVAVAVLQLKYSSLPPLLPGRLRSHSRSSEDEGESSCEEGGRDGTRGVRLAWLAAAHRAAARAARHVARILAGRGGRLRLEMVASVVLLVVFGSCAVAQQRSAPRGQQPSREALAAAGLSRTTLMATTRAPMSPLLSGMMAATGAATDATTAAAAANHAMMPRAKSSAGRQRGAAPASVNAATAAQAAALCPALHCSRDASCTVRNSSCCAHVLLHMLAFMDAHLQSLGHGADYMVLLDTLMDAVTTDTLPPHAAAVDLGVSVDVLATLLMPCARRALWRHGYVLLTDGPTLRLCPHAAHPSAAFRTVMRDTQHQQLAPQRGLVNGTAEAGTSSTAEAAARPGGSLEFVRLHPLWPELVAPASPLPLQHPRQQQQQRRLRARAGAGAAPPASPAPQPVLEWKLCQSAGVALTMSQGRHVNISGLLFPAPDQLEMHLAAAYGPEWVQLVKAHLEAGDSHVGGTSFASDRVAHKCTQEVAELTRFLGLQQ